MGLFDHVLGGRREVVVPEEPLDGHIQQRHQHQLAADADGNAAVVNHPTRLPEIKHGHMGKFKNFSEGEKKAGRKDLKDQVTRFLFKVASEAASRSIRPLPSCAGVAPGMG